MGQTVGLAIQLAIADGLLIHGQRLALRMPLGLSFEQLMHRVQVDAGRRGVPFLANHRVFGCAQHRQVAETAVRCAHHCLQHVLPMLRQTLYRRGVEQVSGVGQRGPNTFRGFMGVQAQVEVRGLVVPIQLRNAQAG
ncbi:hypothetical protein PFUM301598_00580 [Pseudomonas fluorescens]